MRRPQPSCYEVAAGACIGTDEPVAGVAGCSAGGGDGFDEAADGEDEAASASEVDFSEEAGVAVRQPRRRQPDPRVLGQHRAAPHQPRR